MIVTYALPLLKPGTVTCNKFALRALVSLENKPLPAEASDYGNPERKDQYQCKRCTQ